jgi:hypothetical protein
MCTAKSQVHFAAYTTSVQECEQSHGNRRCCHQWVKRIGKHQRFTRQLWRQLSCARRPHISAIATTGSHIAGPVFSTSTERTIANATATAAYISSTLANSIRLTACATTTESSSRGQATVYANSHEYTAILRAVTIKRYSFHDAICFIPPADTCQWIHLSDTNVRLRGICRDST